MIMSKCEVNVDLTDALCQGIRKVVKRHRHINVAINYLAGGDALHLSTNLSLNDCQEIIDLILVGLWGGPARGN